MPEERPDPAAGLRPPARAAASVPRPGRVAALAVGLAVLAGAALWAAYSRRRARLGSTGRRSTSRSRTAPRR